MLYSPVAHTATGLPGSYFSTTGWRQNCGASNRSLVIIISTNVLNTVQSLAYIFSFSSQHSSGQTQEPASMTPPIFLTPTQNEDSLWWLWSIRTLLIQLHYSRRQIGPRFLKIISLVLSELVKPALFLAPSPCHFATSKMPSLLIRAPLCTQKHTHADTQWLAPNRDCVPLLPPS